jgi:hypothetical protein
MKVQRDFGTGKSKPVPLDGKGCGARGSGKPDPYEGC